jgi:hypothetical protein
MEIDDLSSVRRVQGAIRHAVARTEAAREKRDSDFVFVGYVETTMWATALDDLLTAMDPEYVRRRDVDEGGQALRGLRWARNQGVHQLVALHKMSEGRTYPLTYPRRYVEPVWLARAETAPLAKPQRQNEQAYDDHIAGRTVSSTLATVHDFLWMRAIPNQYREQLPWEALTSNG